MGTHTDRDLRILVARSSVPSHFGHHVPLNLAGADLEMATLPTSTFAVPTSKAPTFCGAMLWGAVLDGACLDDADLTCADLTWSSIVRCTMKGTLLVEADLDEASVDFPPDAITAGAEMSTCSPSVQTIRWWEEMVRTKGKEEMVRTTKAKFAHDDAVLRAHEQSAPLPLRRRGAAGFKLCLSEGFTGDWYAYKRERIKQAQTRVLSDADLQELLRWSTSTGKPLNLRGCNLSGADLRNAPLRGACLAFTDATGANIHGVDLAGADLQASCGWD